MTLRGCLVLLLLVPALEASAQDLPGVRVFEESNTQREQTDGPSGPQYQHDSSRVSREAAAAEKRDEAIQVLLELLQIENPTTPEYPKTLIKLADQYWQKSEDFFYRSQEETLLRQIYEAEEAQSATELSQLRAQQQQHITEQQRWQRKALETYRQIERDHPNFGELDHVLYSIGHYSTLLGERETGYQYYAKLVLQRPTSVLVPDTYTNIGDYFFRKNDFQQALAFYAKVEQFGNTRVLGYAIYMSGWCWFNLGDKAKAMNRFYDTVKWTIDAESTGNASALDLRREAQRDMVRAYSYIGAPQKAPEFFKRIAPGLFIDLCEKLGNIYTTDANYSSSNRLYKALISEVGSDHNRVLKYRREIVYNTFKSGSKDRTRETIEELTTTLNNSLDQLPEDFRRAEMQELELLLRIIGTDYHRESERTQNREGQLLALYVYEQYLNWFPDAEDHYTMAFNVALLAYQMEDYARSARLFEKVIELNPEGPYTSHAAHTSLLAYYKLVNLAASEEKQEDIDENYEPMEIPANELLLVNACKRYIELAPPGADDIAEAKYAAARIYYDYNHFDKAVELFTLLYNEHRSFASIQDAARLMLSIFNVTRDIRNLNVWADKFAQDTTVASGELGVKISEIQAARDFNVCRQSEFDEKFEESGNCFMQYFTNFPQSELGDRALNNAAIMYRNAKMIEQALIASERLYNERQDSPIAPQALFNIGSIYKAIAVYSESAYYYELYVRNHPQHNERLLEKALARAATYRRALGQYPRAIANYLNYYRMFSENEKAPRVFFEIGLIYESQENWRAVVRHYIRYLRSYADTADKGYIIAAHTKMGIAQWRQGKITKALEQFERALAIYEELEEQAKAAGQTEVELNALGADSVAAAKFYQGELVLRRMKRIRLRLPQRRFTRSLEQKITLIQEATQRMQEVAQFQRPHWEIAAFNRIGQAYQNLADAIENAPVPRNLPEEAQYLLREQFTEKSQAVRQQAIQAYRLCITRAIEKQWFNEFSDNAEKNLATLDLDYKFTREIRPQPGFYRSNATVPSFAPSDNAELKAALEKADLITDWLTETRAVNEVMQTFMTLSGAGGGDAAVGHYNAGLVYARTGRHGEALLAFQSAAQDSGFANAQAMVGHTLDQLSRPGSQPYFDTALRLEPFNPIANNAVALQAQASTDWTESIKSSRQALIGNAESMNAYQNLAWTYYQTGQYDMARLVCEQAIELNAKNAAMHNLLGLTWIKLDNIRAAIRSFQAAVRGNPAALEPHLNLASAALNFSDFEQSLTHFTAARTLDETNIDAIMGQSVAYRGAEKFEDARRGYGAVIAASPSYPDVHYNLCLLDGAYEEKYEAGLAACEEFIRLSTPEHPKRAEVEQRIRGLRSTIEFMAEQAAHPPLEPEEESIDENASPEDVPSDGEPSDGEPSDGEPSELPDAPTSESDAPAAPVEGDRSPEEGSPAEGSDHENEETGSEE